MWYPTTFIRFAHQIQTRLWLPSIWLCTKFLSTYAGHSTKIMLFVHAWVLIESHRHQAFAYLQMNLLYTYDAKNSLYNIVWNSTSTHNPAYNSVFNCKFKRSFDLKPNQIPPLGIRLQPELQAVGFKTKSSAIAEGPRDASCQLKSSQLTRNSAETTYTTSPDQIDGMK